MALSLPVPEPTFRPSVVPRPTRAHEEPLFEMAQRLARFGSWTGPFPVTGEVRWSEGMYRIFGVPEGTPIDLATYLGLVHPEDRARVQSARSNERDADQVLRYRIVRPDGEVRWVRSTAALERDGRGEPVRVTGVVQDITDELVAVEALRASEARYRRLADSGIIGIALADLQGNLLDMNDAYLALLGFGRDELEAGKIRWTELTPPEWAHTDEAAIAELRATGTAKPWQKELFRKDGTRVSVLLGVAMLDDSRCVVFAADLTEKVKMEAALRASEEQLRQAQKMEAVGQLAGGVAHDFNNLLTVILTYADFLAESFENGDPRRDDAREIRDSAQRAAQLTQRLLAFGRRQVLSPRLANLNEVITGLEKMLRRLIPESVRMSFLAAEGLPSVRVDVGQMEQVLMNLAVNARDAMPRGGSLAFQTEPVMVDAALASSHPGLKPGPHVRLSVRDDGTGIASEALPRIFEPFFTTKGVGQGTGLGLSVVLGIVQQSGGAIGVDSTPGSGTTFHVYLPVADDPAADARASRTEIEAPRPGGSETVLLVDDDAKVRRIARRALEHQGYRVIEAETPGDALFLSDREPTRIDLLLTDVVMPHLDGRDLAAGLRSRRPELKVLFMSGYSDRAVEPDAAQGTWFMPKPFTPSSLAAQVRQALDGGRRAGARAAR